MPIKRNAPTHCSHSVVIPPVKRIERIAKNIGVLVKYLLRDLCGYPETDLITKAQF